MTNHVPSWKAKNQACAAWALNNTLCDALYHNIDCEMLRSVAEKVGKKFILVQTVDSSVILTALRTIMKETDGSAFRAKDIAASINYYER